MSFRTSRGIEEFFVMLSIIPQSFRYVARILKVEEAEEFLIKEPFLQKIKGWNTLFAAMIHCSSYNNHYHAEAMKTTSS